MEIFSNSYIIDIDGTVLNGSNELNSSKQFIESLQKNSKDFLLATNSIKSHAVQVDRFKKIGISISTDKIYSPIDSINRYVEENKINHALIIGSSDEIAQIKTNQSFNSPDLVILLDFEKSNFSYNDLQKIIEHIENGAKTITASKSPYYIRNNRKQIDTGAFVNLIESVTEIPIPVFGKPSDKYFLNAQSILGSSKENTVVIGDDWKTDILGAKNVGFKSALIKSGKYVFGDENNSNPDWVIDSFIGENLFGN